MLLQSVNNLSSVGGETLGGGAHDVSHLSVSFSLLSTFVGIGQSSSCLSGCDQPVVACCTSIPLPWENPLPNPPFGLSICLS